MSEEGATSYCHGGQLLRGCMTCNIWWSPSASKVRLSEEDPPLPLSYAREIDRRGSSVDDRGGFPRSFTSVLPIMTAPHFRY
jgi:hypothetical protein